MIVIDISKQQALDADPRAIQQISFIGKLDRDGNKTNGASPPPFPGAKSENIKS